VADLAGNTMAEAYTWELEVPWVSLSMTVEGRVDLPDGAPAAGAQVRGGRGGVTEARGDGTFTLPARYRSNEAELTVHATTTSGMDVFDGSVTVLPAAGAIVDAGTLVLALRRTFGPSPYLSFQDSPFLGKAFSYFQLEDFEDGALSTPGVREKAGRGYPTVAGFVDSVDGDDGALDGSGVQGHAWLSTESGAGGASRVFEFVFNTDLLGGLPTHVGVVWTDVYPVPDNVMATAIDAAGQVLDSIGPVLVGDGAWSGGTEEDRFFGFVSAGGIAELRIEMATSSSWEIDHLQYGRIAPN
jgi:hypothetical protein